MAASVANACKAVRSPLAIVAPAAFASMDAIWIICVSCSSRASCSLDCRRYPETTAVTESVRITTNPVALQRKLNAASARRCQMLEFSFPRGLCEGSPTMLTQH